MKFYTSRPESFAIYKRTEQDGPWLPYQYYSASCAKTYGKDPKAYIRPGDDERTALCTDEFSDISPLTGGNVAFSTLEGRPSAYNFDQSLVLQVRPCICCVLRVNFSGARSLSVHVFRFTRLHFHPSPGKVLRINHVYLESSHKLHLITDCADLTVAREKQLSIP